jgi:transposase
VLAKVTGGYERRFVDTATENDIPVIPVQPNQVGEFARAQGVFVKTGKMDARLIAAYGVKLQPRVKGLPGKKARLAKGLCA